jgi:mRNA-degrading endonuclease toxin of MazEF toxin-antitoxin module
MRGGVLIVDYPYGDASLTKRRPPLVVQSDNVQTTSLVVALITSDTQRTWPTRLLVDPAAEPASD